MNFKSQAKIYAYILLLLLTGYTLVIDFLQNTSFVLVHRYSFATAAAASCAAF